MPLSHSKMFSIQLLFEQCVFNTKKDYVEGEDLCKSRSIVNLHSEIYPSERSLDMEQGASKLHYFFGLSDQGMPVVWSTGDAFVVFLTHTTCPRYKD